MVGAAMALAVGLCVHAPSVAPHIRSTDTLVKSLLDRGCRDSDTFRWLVARVEASDLIVYVRTTLQETTPGGRTVLVAAAGGRRYVVIMLSKRLSEEALVGLLGHELQHAVEIAAAPEVVDDSTLRTLYRRIGIGGKRADGRWQFDTSAAVAAGRRVIDEITIRAPSHQH